MAEHIEFIRNATGKQLVALKNDLKRSKRESKNSTTNNSERKVPAKVCEMREETIIMNGHSRQIIRIYVTASDSAKYRNVGWVITSDIDRCMICLLKLSCFGAKHHCRGCGNVVCQKCSDSEAIVDDLHTLGPVRVCVQCYWGQVALPLDSVVVVVC